MRKRGKKIFSLLAAVLEYPTERLADQVQESIMLLETVNWDAKHHLLEFREFCLANPLNRIREVYTNTFDQNAACCPYVGHYLLEQDRSRSLFQAKLKEHYSPRIVSRSDIPDHISVMLRSLTVQESVEEALELVYYCLIPAVKKMILQFKNSDNPYRHVLQAVLLALDEKDRRDGLEAGLYGGYALAVSGRKP